MQIGIWKGEINEKIQKKIASINGVEKVHDKGILYKYIAGRYSSLTEAEFRKSEVAQNDLPGSSRSFGAEGAIIKAQFRRRRNF